MNNPENGNRNETFDNYLNFTYKVNPLYISDNKNKPVVKQKNDRNRARKSCGNGATKPANKVIRAN